MTEEADWTKRRQKALTQELDLLRSSTLNLNGEPEFRALADDPALPTKPLLHAYLAELACKALRTRPVFYAEVPCPPPNWRTSWFVKSLLLQWGDPAWDARESSYEKQDRLGDAMHAARVELMIVADLHHLKLSNGRLLGERLDWLLSLFQSAVKIPLVIVGEPTIMEQLILTDGRFCTRFWPLRLPGDPEPKKDPEAERRLRALLGIPGDPETEER